jgi:hypothetical protein
VQHDSAQQRAKSRIPTTISQTMPCMARQSASAKLSWHTVQTLPQCAMTAVTIAGIRLIPCKPVHRHTVGWLTKLSQSRGCGQPTKAKETKNCPFCSCCPGTNIGDTCVGVAWHTAGPLGICTDMGYDTGPVCVACGSKGQKCCTGTGAHNSGCNHSPIQLLDNVRCIL